MSMSFKPLRQYMKDNNISYYYLANQGIESPTLHRIRHDKNITIETLEKLCKILNCQPGELIEYCDDEDESRGD